MYGKSSSLSNFLPLSGIHSGWSLALYWMWKSETAKPGLVKNQMT